MLYQASGQFYLLLDIPASRVAAGGLSKCFLLKAEWNDDRLLCEACRSDRLLPLPVELRVILASLKPPQLLTVRWRDPVPRSWGSAIPPATASQLIPVSFKSDASHFPFDLRTIMNEELYLDQDIGDQPVTLSGSGTKQPSYTAGARSLGATHTLNSTPNSWGDKRLESVVVIPTPG